MSAVELDELPTHDAGRVPPLGAAAPNPSGTNPVKPLTRDLLRWLADTPRAYDETMEAWRSHCPRFTVWEDALSDGLVRIERVAGQRQGEAAIVLTQRGRAVLDLGTDRRD